MSQNYSPQTVTKDLVLCLDGTQGFKGYNAIKKPTEIGQCVLWLDADDPSSITHSSNAVSSWVDKSSGGYNAAQSTSSYQPTYNATAVNGKGAIEFDGTDNSLEVNTAGITLGANGGVAFFMVCRQVEFDNAGGNFYFGNVSSGTTQNYMGVGTSGGNSMDWRLYGDNTTGTETESFYTDTTAYHIHTGIWEKDANGVGGAANIHQFFDGYRANYKTSSINTSNFTTTDTAYIGRQHGGSSSYCKFNVCEIILFNKALTIKERQMVEFYLSRKWDIPLMVSYDTSFQRWPLDLTSNATNSTASTTHTWMSPSVNAARGIFLQNNSGRYVTYGTTGAISNIAAKEGFTIEWAAAAITHDDDTTNYCIIQNENYQSDGFIVRYGGGNWNQPYLRVNHAGGASTTSGGRVDAGDNTVAGEWAHWCITFVNGSGENSIVTFYKNNVQVKQFTDWEVPEADASDTMQFLAQGSQGFCGEMAFLRLYQKALTSKERQTNYLAMRERINGIPKIARPRDVQIYLDAHQYRNFNSSTWFDMGANAGNNAGGTVTNATQVGASSTEWPKCYDFDATDTRISIGSSRMNVSTTAITVAVWVSFDAISDDWIISTDNGSDYDEGWTMRVDSPSNTIGWIVGKGGSSSHVWSTNTLSVGSWYYAVATYKSGEQLLYVDGVLWASGTSTGSIDYGSVTTGYIGARNPGTALEFDGQIANVMIYDTVLSADEVNQNYNYFKNRFGK